MSSQATKWKEEQILIICPGSRTTMAQLGCSELTPPAYRIPTRMFRDEETGEWRPYRTYRRKKQAAIGGSSGANDATSNDDDEWEYVEDPDSDEGAVYPMQGGYIVNMEAFLAFLEHVHGLLTTTFHTTPIVLMTSSQWTRSDCEAIALYIFEKTRTPALSMINSALATQYGLKWPHMTVVDVGFEKVDVTCIYDSRIVNHMEVGFAGQPGDDRAISGGEVFTRRLQELLRDKSFTYEMAEQLKKSPICEVLPYAPENPRLMELPEDDASVPVAPVASVAANGAAGDDAQPKAVDDDLLLEDGAPAAAEDGVLDVATIVTSGQTKEFLAKKDKERSERGRFGRRNKDKEAAEAAAKPLRLPNSKRARVTFHFEEVVEQEEEEPQASSGYHKSEKSGAAAGTNGASNGKSNDEEADGSDDGSEGEGSEMDEDDEEEGEGEDDEAAGEGDAKTTKPATSEEKDGDKPKEESAASTEKPKVEDAPAAEKPVEAETEAPEAAPAPAAESSEKPKEPEAAPAPAAPSSEDKPAASEDATMEDAPAPKEETSAVEKTETHAEKPAEPAAAAEPEAATSTALVPVAPAEVAVVDQAPAVLEPQGRRYKRLRRDFEIGIERFTFAQRFEIDRIVETIYRTVQGIDEFYMRPPCWDNLVFVGNGCRLRGLRDNILQTLNARHLISPSTATMFTSELPSNLGTPTGTGAQTPTGSFNTPPHQLGVSSVNPLLQTATANALGQSVAGGPGSAVGENTHHFHAQTPTSIKLATLPTYLGEWTKNGFEEAMFLGAQVAARLAFCVHNLDVAGQEAQRQMSLSRVDYNELGPKGIRNHAMLG